MVKNRVSDPSSVDDIAQETWGAFFRNYEANVAHPTPVALLATIAVRRVVDWYRRKASVETCPSEEAVSRRQDELLRDRLADRIDSDVIAKVDIERALAELPEEHRQALHLHYIDDLDPETVAAMLGRSRSKFYEIRKEALTLLNTSPLLASYRRIALQKEVQK
jgi:RNA polymerase sigma factor (sigma-70 family)